MKKLIIFLLILTSQISYAQENLTTAGDDVEINWTKIDPIVPQAQLMQALKYLEDNQENFPNKKYLILIDFGKASNKKRFYLINLKTGSVESRLTAHGRGSEIEDKPGYAVKFSNQEGSFATSLGFYKTSETYSGIHGYSLRLDGKSPSNNNARERAIVIHAADYVIDNKPHAGRSHGCPALDPTHSKRIIDLIKGGALIYAFSNTAESIEN